MDKLYNLSFINKMDESSLYLPTTLRRGDVEFLPSTGYLAGKGPVVQSIVSLMSSLRCQLIKCFTTFISNYTDIFQASRMFSTKNNVVY